MSERTVGRDRELQSLSGALDVLDEGAHAVVALVGEPGIGKSRLLRELADKAEERGITVRAARAAEFERELPFGVLIDALDEHLSSLTATQLSGLDPDREAQLAAIFPAFARRATDAPVLAAERYRSHRALLELLDRLALSRPLALLLDDMHAADPATLEFLSSLLRHPPQGRVLVAFALRSGQTPPRLAESMGVAQRDGVLRRLDLGPLDPSDAVELMGDRVGEELRGALLRESGGNPFYLEQLVRTGRDPTVATPRSVDPVLNIPTAVAEAISGELAALEPQALLLLEGAAVAGEPFEPDVAAAAAQLSEEEALTRLDQLLAVGLVRETSVPRRFRFRHPLVHRAVYDHAGGGWRLAAHGRVAAALEQRSAPPAVCAHHVEYSARAGDEGAIELLSQAGQAVAAQTPATAARWFTAALRLLPTGDEQRRRGLLEELAGAESSAGRLEESRRALLEAIELVPDPADPARIALVAQCAATEHWLGRRDAARRRLLGALAALEDGSSKAAASLLLALAFDALYGLNLERSDLLAQQALETARASDDRLASAAAGALLTLIKSAAGQREDAIAERERAVAVVLELTEAELAQRLEILWYLAWAETFLDGYETALRHSRKGLELARATGQGALVVPLMLAAIYPYEMLGRMAEADDVSSAAVEAARLSGNRHHLFWALWEHGLAVLYRGDLAGARSVLEESLEVARDTERNILWESEPGWAISGLLLEEGEYERSIATAMEWCGGPDLPRVVPAERCIGFELLTRAAVSMGDVEAAEEHATRAERHAAQTHRPLARVLGLRCRAKVHLARGDAAAAAETAGRAHVEGLDSGLMYESWRARILQGSALAAAGDRAGAVSALREAEAAMQSQGALEERDRVRRELRRLGHRVPRPPRRAGGEPDGLAALSDRERQVATLVAAGHTNRAIAEELFVTPKTVETHLRNIFGKLGVSSRAAVAATVARDEDA